MTASPTRLFVTIWTIATLAVTALEVLALVGVFGAGSTLSEVVWKLRATPGWRAVIFALWAWLGWHWFGRSLADGRPIFDWRDVYVIIAAAVAGALMVQPK